MGLIVLSAALCAAPIALADRYKRWRHSRGFGVHSPFAFSLISDALYLPSKYSYYQFLDPPHSLKHPLANLPAFNSLKPSTQRRLIRLAIFCQTHRIPLITPHSYLIPHTSSLIPPPEGEAILALLPDKATRKLIKNKAMASGHGLLLDARKYMVYFNLPHIAFSYYTLP